VPGGIMLVLNGVNPETGDRINHLIRLDESGQETLSRRLLFQDYPRTMNFNENDNSLLITFKGQDYIDDILLPNTLTISNYNILGDLRWQQQTEYRGNIVDVVSLSDSYLIAGNYNEMKGIDGIMLRAGNQNTDLKSFVLKVSRDGIIKSLRPTESTGTHYISRLYRVSDDCINLLGATGAFDPDNTLDPESASSVHVILNNNLDILSSNLN
jgi:hypothetical protein